MTCLNDKNSNIVEPLLLSFSIKNLYHTLDHEQPYKKGSSSSIWKKNINPLRTFHLPSSAMISLLVVYLFDEKSNLISCCKDNLTPLILKPTRNLYKYFNSKYTKNRIVGRVHHFSVSGFVAGFAISI